MLLRVIHDVVIFEPAGLYSTTSLTQSRPRLPDPQPLMICGQLFIKSINDGSTMILARWQPQSQQEL